MGKHIRRAACLLLCLCLSLGLLCPVHAQEYDEIPAAMQGAADWLKRQVPAPGTTGYGADWAVFALARSGIPMEESWYRSWLSYTLEVLRAGNGSLNTRKYAEYSRTILVLTALGQDARSFGGYDLTRYLADFKQVCLQGINGPSWALLALGSGDYPMPEDPSVSVQATRQMYVDEILSRQLEDGGWTLTGKGGPGPSDPDVTAMMLQALAKYLDQEAVAAAAEKALDCISAQQQEDGSLASYGVVSSESAAQMLVALCELGLGPEEPRFVKSGGSLLTAILALRGKDGDFLHTADGTGAPMVATEQCLYALTALCRYRAGQPGLYRLTDPLALSAGGGLPGKDPAVAAPKVLGAEPAFPDLGESEWKEAVLGLAARGVLNGFEDGLFRAEERMTRAQFAATAVRAMSLPAAGSADFPDVPPEKWYASWVAAAARFGIVNGRDDGRFDPEGDIDLQEAAAMVCRAARLCGLDAALTAEETRAALKGYTDLDKLQSWAEPTLAWCLKNGVVHRTGALQPREKVLRGEIAGMFWRLLELAKLR